MKSNNKKRCNFYDNFYNLLNVDFIQFKNLYFFDLFAYFYYVVVSQIELIINYFQLHNWIKPANYLTTFQKQK